MKQDPISKTILTFPTTEAHANIIPLQTHYFDFLHSLLTHSQQSIEMCQYVFSATGSRDWQRSEKIFRAIVDAHDRGVDVSIIFDQPKPRSPNARANLKTIQRLSFAGIQPRSPSFASTLHVKIIIIDKRHLLTGSHNLTNSSLYSPFELSFYTNSNDLVHPATLYFASLWLSPATTPFLITQTLTEKINPRPPKWLKSQIKTYPQTT